MGRSIAGTIDPNTADSEYIEYGKKFSCICKVTGVNSDNLNYIASGIVIGPNHIITAAHVVEKIKSCLVIVEDKEYEINKVICHNKFDIDKTGYYDIAIGFSKNKINLDFYPKLYTSDDEIGKACSIAGFGFTGTFLSGATRNDNKKRAGSNIIEYIDRDLLMCNPSRGPHKTSLEFIIASGDSGGGLFIDGKLAGVNSCVVCSKGSPKSDYLTESGHTRISTNIDWILSNTK